MKAAEPTPRATTQAESPMRPTENGNSLFSLAVEFARTYTQMTSQTEVSSRRNEDQPLHQQSGHAVTRHEHNERAQRDTSGECQCLQPSGKVPARKIGQTAECAPADRESPIVLEAYRNGN